MRCVPEFRIAPSATPPRSPLRLIPPSTLPRVPCVTSHGREAIALPPSARHIRERESLCPRLRAGARLSHRRPLHAGVAAPLLRRAPGGAAECGAAGGGGLRVGAPSDRGATRPVARSGRYVRAPVGPDPLGPHRARAGRGDLLLLQLGCRSGADRAHGGTGCPVDQLLLRLDLRVRL